MSIELIPNMNRFLKQKKMEQVWGMKNSGAMDPMEKVALNGSFFNKMVKESQKEPDIKVIRAKVDKILKKLKAGGRLTASEKEFLCKYAPDVYRKLEEVEQKSNAFAARLKSCKNDSEVEQEKAATLNAVSMLDAQDPDMAAVLTRQLMMVYDRLGGKRNKPCEESQGANPPKGGDAVRRKRRDLGRA